VMVRRLTRPLRRRMKFKHKPTATPRLTVAPVTRARHRASTRASGERTHASGAI
jgi:hypothetical protein